MTTKATALTAPLALGSWNDVVTHDWSNTPADVQVMLYLNVVATLADGHDVGRYDVRAKRIGTTDDTALDTRTIVGTPGQQAAAHFVTHHWMGANPGGFVWQVRPGRGIARLQIATRYSKVRY